MRGKSGQRKADGRNATRRAVQPPMFHGRAGAAAVAQSCTLLYRRVPLGRGLVASERPAGWKPAIQQSGTVRHEPGQKPSGTFRPDNRVEPSHCFRLLLFLASALGSWSALAQPANGDTNEIPSLRPPLDLLPRTFWERHGTAAVLVGLAALAALGLLVWRLRRRAPVGIVPPDQIARQALEALRDRAEDLGLIAAVAHHLRSYVQAVLGLPPTEWTADELIKALEGKTALPPELTTALGALLRECEQRSFAAVPPPARPDLAARALELAGRLEALRQPRGVAAGGRGTGILPVSEAAPPSEKARRPSPGSNPVPSATGGTPVPQLPTPPAATGGMPVPPLPPSQPPA
jgi:hypothetical protein